jgi:hypothetical protein
MFERPAALGLRCRHFPGPTFHEYLRKRSLGVKKSTPGAGDIVRSTKMTLSRSFIRKCVISLATTASIAATSLALARVPIQAHHFRGATPIQYVADRSDYSSEKPFLLENDAAMERMMADMAIKPTGDVDRDFVAMMVPHHQGAIDMAQAVLRYGHNEQLRRLAQEIVVTQQQEIVAMRLAVGEELPPSVASPTQPAPMPSSPIPHDAMSHDSMNIK